MSDPTTSESRSAAAPKASSSWRRILIPILAGAPALLVGSVLFFSGEGLAISAWGMTLWCGAVVAGFAVLVAWAARDVRHTAQHTDEQRAFIDTICAEHGTLLDRCAMLATQLAEARASWESLFLGHAHLACIATDIHGTIVACNPGAAALLGMDSTRLVGKASILQFHLEDEIAARRASSAQAGSAIAAWAGLASGDRSAPQTWTWRGADGTKFKIRLAVTARRDAHGALLGYLAVGEDVTARERADQRLHAVQRASRALLAATSLSDALPVIVEAVGSAFIWQHARLWMPAAGANELRPAHQWRAPQANIPSPSAGAIAESVAGVSRDEKSCWRPAPDGEPGRATILVPLKLGRTSRGVFEVTGAANDDEATPLVAMFDALGAGISQFLERKDTEKRMFEAEGAVDGAARAKSDFLALMSHEIRTPMNGVIGMSNLLLETSLSPKQRDFAQTIRSSADSLLSVINDILDFSKIEAGKLAFESVDFNLREVVEDTLDLMAGNAHAKQLELVAHVHADVPHFVRGDPNRLRQVLNNLVANAIKFTAQGEVVVTVAREKAHDQRVVLHFAIRDTGIGIPPEVQKRLFQPFMQADTSTTRRFGGTGLGLAISRQLVSLMHGRIGVVSEEGRGSTFHFTIRLDPATDPALNAAVGSLPDLDARVLVVDRHATTAGIVTSMLKAWGLKATRTTGTDAARACLAEAARIREPFDLILVDAELPGTSSPEFIAEIRRQFTPPAKFVLLAGVNRQFTDDDIAAAGAAAWLSRPIRESRLREIITATLAGGAHPPFSPTRPRWVPPMIPASTAPVLDPAAPRILLVEDNVINQQIALQTLARMTLTADVAANGVEALVAMRRTPYEVILMDCMMPEMDGYETTRRIREVERRRAALGIARPEVHIIALTANSGPDDRTRCLQAGMNDFVAKPLRPDELEARLQRWRTRGRTATAPVSVTAG